MYIIFSPGWIWISFLVLILLCVYSNVVTRRQGVVGHFSGSINLHSRTIPGLTVFRHWRCYHGSFPRCLSPHSLALVRLTSRSSTDLMQTWADRESMPITFKTMAIDSMFNMIAGSSPPSLLLVNHLLAQYNLALVPAETRK